MERQPDPKPRYTGGHFEENDVVAHIRFNERVDPDGNKVLFIEEIQGDWAHKGQEQGFKGPKDTAAKERYDWIQNRKGEIQKELRELGEVPEGNYGLGEEGQKELDEVTAQLAEWSQRNSRSGGAAGTLTIPEGEQEIARKLQQKIVDIKAKHDPKYVQKQELMKESNLLQKEAQDLTAVMRSGGSPEPGPFVTDTHQWTNLALKRMIRWGSDNGFDSIAWVTGKQSADRYKASTMVDSIFWNPDTTELVAIEKGGNRKVINEKVPENKLADYIGKEPANRLLESPRNEEKFLKRYEDGLVSATERDYMLGSHELHGADLDIGGEYHKLIYDQVLTAQAKKIGKKHGAKVEEGTLSVKVGPSPTIEEAGRLRFEIRYDDGEVLDAFESRAAAERAIEDGGPHYADTEVHDLYWEALDEQTSKAIQAKKGEKIWTMRLTDKLKQASKDGMPYYVALPPLVMGAAAQRTDAQRQQSKSDAQQILAN